jgi:hypothetical protein
MAGTSVPIPDQDAQNFLDNARSQAAQSLRGKVPDSMLEPITAQPKVNVSVHGPAPSAEPPANPPPVDPGPSAVPLSAEDGQQPAPPSPSAQPPDDNTFGRAWKESAEQLDSEAGKAIVRAGAALAKGAAFLGSGVNHILSSGRGAADDQAGAAQRDDTIFNAVRNYIDPLYKRFASDPNANPYAKTVGGVLEGVAPMVLGPAGVPAIAATQTTEAGADSIDRGNPASTAATLAVIRGVAAAAGAAIPSKDPRLIPRIAKWVGAGEALDAASNALTRWVLNQDSYKTAVENYKNAGRDPDKSLPAPSTFGTEYADADRKNAGAVPDVLDLKDASVTALMQTVFALLHSPQAAAVQANAGGAKPPSPKAEPLPDLSAGTEGQEPPPPGAPPAAPTPPPAPTPPAAPAAALKASPAPSVKSVPAVPDVPTAEPVGDLMAQKADAQDPATPRQGVYLSKDAKAALSKEDLAALKDGMVSIPNFDKKGGLVLVPDSDTAKAVRAFRATEPDMQKVLGRITGAGEGKSPDQTAVVQGQTPEGAVAKEGAVAPEQVPAAVQAVAQEGKIPIVTTPEAAQARRAAEVEQSQPAPSEVAPKPQGANEAAAPVSEPEGGTSATPPEAQPTEPEPKFAAGQRKLVRIAGEDVPVVVAGESVNGKVPVRAIDDEGRVSKDIRQVPEHMFRGEEAKAPAAAPAEAPPEPKAGTTEPTAAAPPIAHDLKAAVDLFKQQNTPEPGRKFAGTVKEHAQRVAELARAVVTAAKDKSLPDAVRQHAVEAARRVSRMDQKSDEAIAKNQGVGHKMLDQHAENLLRAADNIMDPENAKIPEKPVAVKAEALKAKILKAREKANATSTPEPAAAGSSSEAPKARKLKDKAAASKRDSGGTADAAARQVKKEAVRKVLDNLTELDAASLRKAHAEITKIVGPDFPSMRKLFPNGFDDDVEVHDRFDRAAREVIGDLKPEKIKTAIPDVEDVTKPKKLTPREQRDAQGAVNRYLNAEDHEAPEAHDDMERVLSEIYGPDRAHEVQNIIQMVREQRDALKEDAYTPKRMSDTLDEDELKGHYLDEGDEDVEPSELQKLDPAGTSLQALTDKLNGSGFWKQLAEARDKGTFLSTHKMLAHLANVAKDDPAMSGLIAKLRAHAPDLPIRPVDRTVDPRDGSLKDGIGLHHVGSNTIQLLIPKHAGMLDSVSVNQTHAILHEIAHAATSYELARNPTGEFATQIKQLLAEARERVIAGEKETGAYVTHYGLKNEHEFVAEALTNPRFQEFLRSIEPPDNRGFVRRIMDAVKQLFGAKDPRIGNLLDRSMRVIDRGLATQRDGIRPRAAGDYLSELKAQRPDIVDRLRSQGDQSRANEHMPGLDDLLNGQRDVVSELKDPPPPLPHDDEFRSAVGDHATEVARLFRRAVRSGAVEQVRRNVRAFTTWSQLVRVALRRGVFGANTHDNPLRQYDETIQRRDSLINQLAHDVGNIVNDRAKLSYTDDKKLGQFQIDSTMYGIDPEGDKATLPSRVTTDPKFEQRWQDFQDRWNALTDQQRDIYRRERDMNGKLFRANRRAAIDAALKSFSDVDVPQATRRLLYSVDNPADFKGLIGPKGIIDVGERNDRLVESLQDLASTYGMEGPYFHLGRHGDHVVQANPEGTRLYATEGAARAFAARVEALSPRSKATVEKVGGDWQVDYKADYVSMHSSPAEAEAEIERLRQSGIDVGSATTKILSERNAALSGGVQNIIAEANRRLERRGADNATKELQETLRQSFVQLMAARSAYAASKLARKNVGGVKGEEMGRNFATHAQSMAWNTGHLATVFDIGEALGKLREAVKDTSQPQGIAHQRGRVYDELSRRLAQENQQFGQHTPFNSLVAKAGFLNYMTSFSHSLIYLTQNFSTSIPVAISRHGAFRTLDSFRASMGLISSPAFRETFRALALQGNADSMMKGVIAAVAKDKRFGKWAQGDNPPLQQLIDRGAIHTSLSNQLSEAAKGGNKIVNRVFEYARILPSMADLFNRVSTGLAALELYKGDVYRAGDFIKETHMDYSQGEKPRAFRAVSHVWGGNSITMFRTYTQGMAHLLYSHIFDLAHETEGGRAGALKVVAGMMLGATLFAGLQKGAGLEPIRAMLWAFHKIAGDNDKYYNFDNQSRRFVSQVVGEGKIADVINGGLPRAFGFDISSRMGLSDLFYHDPPDISTLDATGWAKIASGILGPGYQEVADQTHALSNAFATGRVSDFAKAIPIKILQNAVNAYTAATEGATNARGIQLTEPSVGGAVANAIGVKTADQAKVQEKQNTDSDYRQWAETRKYQIIQRYVQADPEDRPTIRQQAQNFSNNNPGYKITYQDLIKAQTSLRRQQQQVTTGVSRDPVQNILNDY